MCLHACVCQLTSRQVLGRVKDFNLDLGTACVSFFYFLSYAVSGRDSNILLTTDSGRPALTLSLVVWCVTPGSP